MPHYVALLRGINLGKRRIKMATLTALFSPLGFEAISTVLASGNVLFASPRRSAFRIEAEIAAMLQQNLGYPVPTHLRTSAELRAIIHHAPFGQRFLEHPRASTQVTFFNQPIAPPIAAELEALGTRTDQLKVIGRELYWRCATRLSESPLWQDPRKNPHLLASGTTRNLQTLQKIAAKLPA